MSRLLQFDPGEPGNLEVVGRAYALHRNPALGALLRDQLASADPETRILATEAIGLSKDFGFSPFLEERLRTEADAEVRKRIEASLRALRQLPGNP